MLEVNHINRNCGGKKAPQDFSCVLEPDEAYGLPGANGSGKTTLIKLIADLILLDGGEVLLNGTPVSTASRTHIVYMSTEPYFYLYMKVRDVGEYYRGLPTDFSQKTHREILGTFQLSPNLRIKNLSSGMMARAKVTVTMSRKADVILLDGPLNGTGLIVCDRVMDLIISRTGHESTLLLSSHLAEGMKHFISKTIFAKDSNMIADLDVKELRIKGGLSLTGKYRQLLT